MKKKKVYCLRTKISPDSNEWTSPSYYKTKAKRDKEAAFCRIIGGFVTHSFEETKPLEEYQQMWFD